MSELNWIYNSLNKRRVKPSKLGEILLSLKLMIHFHYGPRSHPSYVRETNTRSLLLKEAKTSDGENCFPIPLSSNGRAAQRKEKNSTGEW